MRIAVACCGLGHVTRGIEVWARDLAHGLSQAGVEVALFKGAGRPQEPYEVVVPCIRRGSVIARCLAGLHFPGLWRTPLASPYNLEAFSFTRRLLPYLRSDFDLVHLQDPPVARWLLAARRAGRIQADVILANGTEEPPEVLCEFDYLQELDQFGLDELAALGLKKPGWFAIPNFVDTEIFRPGDSNGARGALGLSQDAFVLLSVGALHRSFKRMDWLIREFAQHHCEHPTSVLVLAGATTPESASLIAEARSLLGDAVRVFSDVDHDQMPRLYQAADAFAFCVTHGIYGIALAEAAATGLPCIVHDWQRVKWVAGPEAIVIDMTCKGALAEAIGRLCRDPRRRASLAEITRKWAEQELSKRAIIPRYIDMYQRILEVTELRSSAKKQLSVRART